MSDDEIKPTAAVPPPERKHLMTIRIFEDDKIELERQYPDGISMPIRRLVRRLADKHRQDRGEKPRGHPPEKN